jgi:hypothetical protein
MTPAQQRVAAELGVALDELDAQIRATYEQFEQPHLVRDTNGGYLLAPLLTAKANALASLALLLVLEEG